jgi:preprotein translocase subunit Sec63
MADFDWKCIDKNVQFRSEDHNNKYDANFDFYGMLEIMPSATNAEIKKAFRKKALTVHPDPTRVANKNISRSCKHSLCGS